jgi:hypothetical protein
LFLKELFAKSEPTHPIFEPTKRGREPTRRLKTANYEGHPPAQGLSSAG